MRVRFWGTRGSLPVAAKAAAVRQKVAQALVLANGRRFSSEVEALAFVDGDLDFAEGNTYGGATSCVEIEGGDGSFIVCDMGSGLREFGLSAAARCAAGHKKEFHFFLSHLHWDHIMGFPFFVAAFDFDTTCRAAICVARCKIEIVIDKGQRVRFADKLTAVCENKRPSHLAAHRCGLGCDGQGTACTPESDAHSAYPSSSLVTEKILS